MTSFTDILNKPADQIEAPKPLPVGTYLCLVEGQPEHKQMGKNNTDCFEFPMKFMQPGPDVDQEALLENLNGKSLQDRKLKHRLFVTEDSIWRLKKFLEDLGIEIGSRGLGQVIPESMGRQVMLTIGHRASEDGTQVFMEVKGTAKV